MLMTPKTTYNNILVFNPAFLGDTILTTPLLKALRRIYPQARISFCVRPEHADLFRETGFIDEVICFDKRGSQKGISGLLKFSDILSDSGFDLVINLHLSLRSSTLFSFTKKTFVIGFSSAVMSYLFNKRVERKQDLCEVERNLTVLSALCDDFSLDEAKKLGGNLACFLDERLKRNALAYFSATTGKKRIIGIAPGSVWDTKRYPAEYFAEIAETLYAEGYAIALFGSKEDVESLAAFDELFQKPYYDFAAKTTLKELPAILSAIDLLIVNDSGAMHIANAAGTSAVAIFGPTVRSLGFFPYDNKSIVIENNDVPCRPCGKHGGKRCPKKHFKCMRDIAPMSVVLAVKEWFRANG